MTADPKRIKEFMTRMDEAVMEEQSREQLYLARKTRWKYRRTLQAALSDYERESKPVPQLQPQPTPPTRQAVVVGLCAAPFFVAGALALFFLTLWVLTGGPFR